MNRHKDPIFLICRLIREMALAGMSPTVPREEAEDDSKELRTHRKFHASPLYRRKAEATFRLWGIPVYIVPVYRKDYPRTGRGRHVGWDEALPLLKRSGLDLGRLEGELAGGGCIILATSKQIVDRFWPTPWMLLHALFDDTWPGAESRELKRRTCDAIADKIDELSGRSGDYNAFMRALLGSMTMRSAREGLINVDVITDISAELAIQAAVSSKGCVLKPHPADPGIDALLRQLEDFINSLDVRGALEDYMGGHIIAIEGEAFDYDVSR